MEGENGQVHRTKGYSACLANLLPGVDTLEACKVTPLTIHGVTYDSPLECEDCVSNLSPFESTNILTNCHGLAIFWGWYSWSLGR
jgi:hypothetical protein